LKYKAKKKKKFLRRKFGGKKFLKVLWVNSADKNLIVKFRQTLCGIEIFENYNVLA